jgi:uncharacterized membrane protein YbhN (UPF0104 family)
MNRIKRIAGHPAVKIGYFAFLVAAAVYYLYRWGESLPDLISQMQPAWAVAALAVTVLAGLVYVFTQFTIFRRLDAPVSLWTTFRIITISQLGKYLPGKVMFFGNYYLLSRSAGISNLQVGTSFVVSMALWMLTACLCALPVLSLLDPALKYTVLLVPVAVLLLINPRVLGWFLRLGQWVGGQTQGQRLPLPEGLSVRFYLWVALLDMLNWALAGLGAWFCLRALGPVALETYPLVLAALAVGTVAGFVAIFAPAGLGIREGLGALILTPVLGAEVALLGLLLLRGISVVVDLSLALFSMAAGAKSQAAE